jgi:hypothetical protein
MNTISIMAKNDYENDYRDGNDDSHGGSDVSGWSSGSPVSVGATAWAVDYRERDAD